MPLQSFLARNFYLSRQTLGLSLVTGLTPTRTSRLLRLRVHLRRQPLEFPCKLSTKSTQKTILIRENAIIYFGRLVPYEHAAVQRSISQKRRLGGFTGNNALMVIRHGLYRRKKKLLFAISCGIVDYLYIAYLRD